MPKFFVKNEQIKDNEITILGEDVKHIANVLRLKKEDEIQICNLDTKMNYIANINEIDKKYVKCKIKKNGSHAPIAPTILKHLLIPCHNI